MERIPLGEIVTIIGGGTPDKSVSEYWGGSIPWASVKDFKSTKLDRTSDVITELGVKMSATNIIPAGTIIVPTRMAVGKAAINEIPLAINQDLKALFPKKGVCTRYLLHSLLSQAAFLEKQAKGATVKGITLNTLKELIIPLPPLAEQKRIAAILDKADAVRQKRQQAIDLLDDLLRSTFLDMFGDPVSSSKGWEMQSMEDVAESVTYGTSEKAEVLPDGVPVLRMANITNDGRIDLSDLKYLKASALSQGKYLLEDGDLLFNRTNSRELVGKTAVWANKMEMAYVGYLIRVRFKKSVSPFYISAALNSVQGKAMLYAMAKPAVNMSNISASDFKRIRLSIPPVSLQKEYEKVVKKTQKQRQSLQSFKDEADVLFSALVQLAFKGEL